MKKTIVALGLVIALVLTACGSKSTGPSAAAGASSTANLKVLDAKVSVELSGKTSFSEVTASATLHQSDKIQTDAAGLGEVDYPDGSLTRVGPNSGFELTTLQTQTGSRKIDQTLDTGLTYSRVEKLTGSESFSVSTSNATASVRGTTFAVGCLASGVCDFASVLDPITVTTTSGGKSATVDTGQNVSVSASGELGKVTTTLPDYMAAWIAQNQKLDAANPPPAATPSAGASQGAAGASGLVIGTWKFPGSKTGKDCAFASTLVVSADGSFSEKWQMNSCPSFGGISTYSGTWKPSESGYEFTFVKTDMKGLSTSTAVISGNSLTLTSGSTVQTFTRAS
jgi:FecR protein.